MFQELVAEHYTKKGYKVHEARKVRGKSGSVYLVDMVCIGDIGHLVITFGDEGGIEGPELGAVKRIAQDIGAAPVAAVPDPTPAIRRMANQAGVAIVDQDALIRPDAQVDLRSEDQIDHPWPRSGERRSDDEGLWSQVRETKSEPFGWLQTRQATKTVQHAPPVPAEPAPEPRMPVQPVIEYEPEPEITAPIRRVSAPTRPAPTTGFETRMLIGPALYGAVTAIILLLFWLLFG